MPNCTPTRSVACWPGMTSDSCCSCTLRWKLALRPVPAIAFVALVAKPPMIGLVLPIGWFAREGVALPGTLPPMSWALPTWLAAVSVAGALLEKSGRCSMFSSVNSSLGGGSAGVGSSLGGSGGGRACPRLSSCELVSEPCGWCFSKSFTCGGFAFGCGFGANMLAQVFFAPPSGIRLLFAPSEAVFGVFSDAMTLPCGPPGAPSPVEVKAAGASLVGSPIASQALDSVVGTDTAAEALRDPLAPA